MIRKLTLAVGLFALTGASAMAAPAATVARTNNHVAKGDEPAPPADGAKKAKKAHKGKKAKDDKSADGAKEPAPAPAPAK
jgi:hypothetical protein